METFPNNGKPADQSPDGGYSQPLGQALLSALVELIQPIIQTYTPISHIEGYLPNTSSPSLQKDGQELLSTLNRFIAGAVQRQVSLALNKSDREQLDLKTDPGISRPRARSQSASRIQAKITNMSVSKSNRTYVARSRSFPDLKVDPEEIDTGVAVTSLGLYRTPVIHANTNLPPSFMENLRRHVFNKMPIRLLAFGSKGENITLIDRKGILGHIIRAAHEMLSSQDVTKPEPYREIENVNNFIKSVSPYAILSHTWIRDTPGDVVFNEWDTRHLNLRGQRKIAKFCEVAAIYHGITLAWMDTVCINKESSSELDESIRSMYKWYRQAAVCVAYLAETKHIDHMAQDSWFTRGWTLQELLAPRSIHFYDTHWCQLHSYDIHSSINSSIQQGQNPVTEQIFSATTITAGELSCCKTGAIHLIPMSRRMQLGANRHVTREEDTAYSMMGILGVDISIAYGEGSERALSRLVQAYLISKKYTLDVFNQSIQGSLIPTSITQYASRSSVFDNMSSTSKGMPMGSHLEQFQPKQPITITHLGVRVQLLIIPAILTSHIVWPRDQQLSGPLMTVKIHFSGDAPTEYTASINQQFLTTMYSAHHATTARRNVKSKIYLGILNIGWPEHGEYISMPTIHVPALAVPLLLKVQSVSSLWSLPRETTYFVLQKTTHPVVFQWKGPANVPKQDLAKYGMKLETLYL